MPIYEYNCKSCNKRFEVLQKSTEEPLKVCSECKGQLEKLISRSAFHLKGSGWYVTDFAGKKTAADKKAPSSAGCAKPDCGAAAKAIPGDTVGDTSCKPSKSFEAQAS